MGAYDFYQKNPLPPPFSPSFPLFSSPPPPFLCSYCSSLVLVFRTNYLLYSTLCTRYTYMNRAIKQEQYKHCIISSLYSLIFYHYYYVLLNKVFLLMLIIHNKVFVLLDILHNKWFLHLVIHNKWVAILLNKWFVVIHHSK